MYPSKYDILSPEVTCLLDKHVIVYPKLLKFRDKYIIIYNNKKFIMLNLDIDEPCILLSTPPYENIMDFISGCIHGGL